uniref:UBC core domain-containing protein n=1 Tax=Chlamydomonas euryale TaxID=1486919 RepID=A0A7R9Z5X6_9CHLO|mmetsp:Transcript_5069/g.15371  ORF Transcript_5069/g.15371 Transcript_5069/m.15371 type:complete len:852 (+) Transcript_5069:318-2873(+)
MASGSGPPEGWAAQRLARDLRQLAKAGLRDIAAAPTDDDPLRWSANMVASHGRWKGMVVHLHLKFPSDYPMNPPAVELMTNLNDNHPNVFYMGNSSWICLDMLKDPGWYAAPYQGWSSAYSVTSVLQQLLGFLLVDEAIEQDYGGTVSRNDYCFRIPAHIRTAAVQLATTCSCGFHTLPRGCGVRVGGDSGGGAAVAWRDEGVLPIRPVSERLRGSRRFHRENEPAHPPPPPGGPTVEWAARVVAARQAARPAGAIPPRSAARAATDREAGGAVAGEQQGSNGDGGSDEAAAAAAAATDTGSCSAVDEDTLTGPSFIAKGAPNTAAAAASSAASPTSPGGWLDLLDGFLLRQVLQHLRPQDLHRCQRIGGRVERAAADVLQRAELVCFHTKAGAEEGALLGFGVAREWHGGRGDGRGGSGGSGRELRGASLRCDGYLSWDAFRAGVRRSVWNHTFDAFLPLYLNPEHGQRCLRALPAFLAGLSDSSCSLGRPEDESRRALDARRLLSVLGHLLNSLMVELMGGVVVTDGGGGGSGSGGNNQPDGGGRALCDAALAAFCHLHHLLLAVALQPGSGIVDVARADVKAFLADPKARHKRACPDLGLLLVELLLVPQSEAQWERVAPALLQEVLARQVRWIIKDKGEWFGRVGEEVPGLEGESKHDAKRLTTHFKGAAVSLRLCMLQAWFSNTLGRPSCSHTATVELTNMKLAYDERSGLPPRRVFHAFGEHARAVMHASSWIHVLNALHLGFLPGAKPRAVFVAALRQAVVDSYTAGYHLGPAPGMPPRKAPPLRQQAQAQDSRARGGQEGGEAVWMHVGTHGRHHDKGAPRRAPPAYLDWACAPIVVVPEKWV